MRNKHILIVSATLFAIGLNGCNDGGGGVPAPDPVEFPVNETYAGELVAAGVPADIARFFAAAKLEASNPDPNTFLYNFFYPNGAVREITLKFTPNRTHSPTPDEIARDSDGGPSIYAFTYANSLGPDWKGRLDMTYFVPNSGIPDALLASLKKNSAAGRFAAGEASGAGIAWGEVAKTGADVGIGSVIDYYKDKGVNVGKVGVIYAMASAASAVGGALQLSQQNGKWLAELEALENCAANPTNPVAQSDPNYIRNTTAKVKEARSELKEVNAVRFLNQMTETGAGFTPATAVMSVGMKQGFVWSEQTLGDYSENTIMREARLAVVACGDPEPLKGNVTVDRECTTTWGSGQVDHEVGKIVSEVSWVWNAAFAQYRSRGTYTYTSTETATYNGKTCTYRESSAGSIDDQGAMIVIDDAATANALGFAYSAGGFVNATIAFSEDCGGNSGTGPHTVTWLPDVQGFPGTGGSIEGVRTKPVCIGEGSTGTETVTYEFSVPAKE